MRLPRYPLLLTLAFASGVCGLAYEVLYARLLTTYLGDMLQVSAAILASFLTGLGVGSLVAHRYHRWLWLIEGLIGLYGALVAWTFSSLPPAALVRALPATATHLGALVVCVVLLVALPSLLIGTSVPLFAAYLSQARKHERQSDGFARVYTVYNVGAGACVLLLEFWLLRSCGLRDSMLLVALVNLATAATLKLAVPAPALAAAAAPAPARRDPATPRGPWLALFFVSALSACYQLFMLRWVGSIFGPFHENFALVLCLVMTGLAAGATLVRRWQLRLPTLLVVGGLVLLGSAIMLPDLARLWAAVSGMLTHSSALRSLAKALVMALMALPSLCVLGATVPALLRDLPSTVEAPGRALAVSSFGNCLGYLAAILFLIERLPHLSLLALVAVGTLLAGVVISPLRSRRVSFGLLAALALSVVLKERWPAHLMALGNLSFLSSERLEAAEHDLVGFETIRRLDGDVTIVTTRSGAEYVTINGYTSFAVAQDGGTNHREVIVGIAPALYPPRRARALVLGTGTGVTAGATALLFEQTRVVEINPAVYAALPRFNKQNFDLGQLPGVELLLDDGLSVLSRMDDRYDLIISTVTSPLFFASSKLYTRDFFELVKDRLNPGGVFAFWFDARLSSEGTAIVLETMARSFADCHFVFLHESYYEAICGVAPLSPRPLGRWPAALERALARWADDTGVDALLDAIILAPGRWQQRWAEAPNTFDLPVLEHVMAREALAGDQAWNFDDWVALDLGRSVLHAGDPPDQAKRCHLMARIGARSSTARCRSLFADAAAGRWDRRYLDLGYQHLMRTGRSVIAFTDLVRGLLSVGDKERALAILERRKKGRTLDLELLRLELALELREDVDDAEVAQLFSRSPLSPAVRRFLVNLSLGRRELAQAFGHLQFLTYLDKLSEREQRLYLVLQQRLRQGAGP